MRKNYKSIASTHSRIIKSLEDTQDKVISAQVPSHLMSGKTIAATNALINLKEHTLTKEIQNSFDCKISLEYTCKSCGRKKRSTIFNK